MEDIRKQKLIVSELIERVKILRDDETKIELSRELLILNKMRPISPEMLMDIRKELGLQSAYWCTAEKQLIEENII